MPIIRVEMFKGRTPAQKKAIAKELVDGFIRGAGGGRCHYGGGGTGECAGKVGGAAGRPQSGIGFHRRRPRRGGDAGGLGAVSRLKGRGGGEGVAHVLAMAARPRRRKR